MESERGVDASPAGSRESSGSPTQSALTPAPAPHKPAAYTGQKDTDYMGRRQKGVSRSRRRETCKGLWVCEGLAALAPATGCWSFHGDGRLPDGVDGSHPPVSSQVPSRGRRRLPQAEQNARREQSRVTISCHSSWSPASCFRPVRTRCRSRPASLQWLCLNECGRVSHQRQRDPEASAAWTVVYGARSTFRLWMLHRPGHMFLSNRVRCRGPGPR